MLNKEIAQAIVVALEFRERTLIADKTLPAALLATQSALGTMRAIASGDTIASLWSVDDVTGLRPDCDVSQSSEDGEDDGLTWFHCDTHDEDTLDDNVCEQAPDTVVQLDTARRVLELADSEHDAEVGINWDSLRSWLDYVEGGE